MPSLRAAALTDIGRVRRENEDRLLCDDGLRLFGVADGVGGLPGGAEAAQAAVDEVTQALRALSAIQEPDLVKIFRRANDVVAKLGQTISPAMGIGTTLTAGCIRGSTFRIGHVGDSRCYVAHQGEFKPVTEDHSVENEARIRRARGEVVYYHEANRNALTRCIGQPTPLEVDIFVRPLVTGERYLFCTDGVTRMIPDSELGTLVQTGDNPAKIIEEIVGLAVRRGGPDNATAVILFVDEA